MPQMNDGFEFEDGGLASIFKKYRLEVPLYQREYSWSEDEVEELFADLHRAKMEGTDHFLGTIVTINQGADKPLLIVDGQQRLTTTSLLITAIRDEQIALRHSVDATNEITRSYLFGYDIHESEHILRLTLNVDDRDFYGGVIRGLFLKPTRESHHRIQAAFQKARTFVKEIIRTFQDVDKAPALNDWIKFLDHHASVILVKTKDASRAFKMFETLNDRGLKTSQADLVKSFLFGESKDRIEEAQSRWSSMKDNLEEIEEDDRTINFLRHTITATTQFVRADGIFDTTQKICRGRHAALRFLNDLELLSRRYVATFQPSSSFWNGYSDTTIKALSEFNRFDLKPIRPLLLALALKFKPKQFEPAIQLLVSLSVRLIIAGRTRSGVNEQTFASAALDVYNGAILTAQQLAVSLRPVTVTDQEFADEFATATVSKSDFARYYLRALESANADKSEPWHVTNENSSEITLEHVLPQKLNENWSNFDQETHRIYRRRIGNLCLLTKSGNNSLGSKSFAEKKDTIASAGLELTKSIAAKEDWGPAEIDERQAIMAKLAVKAWPVSVK